MATKKKASGGTSGGQALRNAVVGAVGTEALLELVQKLGLVDLVVGRLKSKFEETDIDELFEEVGDYLKRNPEVLVVGLGALTLASGLLVWLNSRREWDGTERRRDYASEAGERTTRTTSSTGRVRKAS